MYNLLYLKNQTNIILKEIAFNFFEDFINYTTIYCLNNTNHDLSNITNNYIVYNYEKLLSKSKEYLIDLRK